ncbi:MAG: hypothetical protein H6712_13890 [Myxococcales bacterium]|nr:hypothetical protein [Myxococcales bacterium]MCB9714953.1 hypothetical protein [Myxococcales bacterium]
MTPLLEATIRGDAAAIQALLAEGVDVDARLAQDPEQTNVILGGMRARDIAWRFHDLAQRDALAGLCRDFGIHLSSAGLDDHLRRAPRGVAGVLDVLRRLDPEGTDGLELEALIDGSELSAWARILSLLVSNDETFPIELVGEWSSFQSEGNLDHPSTRADGFIDTVRIDADGTFELTRADETSLLGRWSTDPLSLRSEDARIDVDWIPSMPALLLEVDGTLLAFAPAPLARELARFADAYYADTEA